MTQVPQRRPPPAQPKPIVRDASDEDQVSHAEDLDRSVRERELQDLGDVLSTEAGRRLIYRLLGIAGVYRSSFTGNSTTFFNEGQRSVGLIFLDDINTHFPERFLEMLCEAKRRQEEHA
jgi:hypothetical protein